VCIASQCFILQHARHLLTPHRRCILAFHVCFLGDAMQLDTILITADNERK